MEIELPIGIWRVLDPTSPARAGYCWDGKRRFIMSTHTSESLSDVTETVRCSETSEPNYQTTRYHNLQDPYEKCYGFCGLGS
jgi:hypothetical protein